MKNLLLMSICLLAVACSAKTQTPPANAAAGEPASCCAMKPCCEGKEHKCCQDKACEKDQACCKAGHCSMKK